MKFFPEYKNSSLWKSSFGGAQEQDNSPVASNYDYDRILGLSTYEKALTEDHSVGLSDTLDTDTENQLIIESLYTSSHGHWTRNNNPHTVQGF